MKIEIGVRSVMVRKLTLEEGQAVYFGSFDGPLPAENLADQIRNVDPRTNWISWHDDNGRVTVPVSSIAYVRNLPD